MIFGGLFLENMVELSQGSKTAIKRYERGEIKDKYLRLQIGLFLEKYTQGIQIRVAHQDLTPDLTLDMVKLIADKMPENFLIFIHFGAENVGVDLGCSLDEKGIFKKYGGKRTWKEWNIESTKWGLNVGHIFQDRGLIPFSPLGVIHLGYGVNPLDSESFHNIVTTLGEVDDGTHIALENVPPMVRKSWWNPQDTKHWGESEEYWGFGSTPKDMATLLLELGPKWKMFHDFAHTICLWKQAQSGITHLADWQKFDTIVDAFKKLHQHVICHYTGLEDSKKDIHGDFDNPLKQAIKERIATELSEKEIICLEIPFNADNPDATKQMIKEFIEDYLS